MLGDIKNWFTQADAKRERIAMIIVLFAGAVALLASFVLSIEALVLAKNPEATLNCDLNAVISCATVANHWSASILGFPNSFIGLMALPAVITIAVSILAGAKYPRWFMVAMQLGVTFGLAFAVWMLFMSLSVIQVLCPWCFTVDIAMLAMFYGVTRYNILRGVVTSGGTLRLKEFVERGYDTLILAASIVLLIAGIILKFGEQLFL